MFDLFFGCDLVNYINIFREKCMIRQRVDKWLVLNNCWVIGRYQELQRKYIRDELFLMLSFI